MTPAADAAAGVIIYSQPTAIGYIDRALHRFRRQGIAASIGGLAVGEEPATMIRVIRLRHPPIRLFTSM